MRPNPKRRDAVLRFVTRYYDREGVAPTVREIVGGCGLSGPSLAHHYLQKLVEDGSLRNAGSRGYLPVVVW